MNHWDAAFVRTALTATLAVVAAAMSMCSQFEPTAPAAARSADHPQPCRPQGSARVACHLDTLMAGAPPSAQPCRRRRGVANLL